jgi:hypothetical protein
MVESLEGDHESRPFADIKGAAGSLKFSPDGGWLAYCSNESKKPQVYGQAFPGPGPKIQCQAMVAPIQCGREPVASFIRIFQKTCQCRSVNARRARDNGAG